METVDPTSRQKRKMWQLMLLTGLFIACVAGAWFWVRSGEPAQSESYWFEGRTNVASLQFIPQELDAVTMDKLGAARVLNGEFTNAASFGSHAFLASWTGDEGKNISLVEHTPDICWPNIGLKPVELGQPRQIFLSFQGQELPFECRVFEARDGRRKMVIWCSLLGGKVMPELDMLRLSAEDSNDRYKDHASRSVTVRRRLKITQFIGLISHRLPKQGNRQLAIYSLPISSGWSECLGQITNTCPQWLALTATNIRRQAL